MNKSLITTIAAGLVIVIFTAVVYSLNEEDMKNTSGQAFPLIVEGDRYIYDSGMTIRDYFAAKAMKVTIEMNDYNINEHQAKQVAKWAYMCADAMIAEREK